MAEQPVREQRCGSRTGWAVIQSHPQAERWARENLLRQGFDAYLPLITVTRRDPVTRTMTRQVERPLFTSYLFAYIQSDHAWSPIAHTRGVARLLLSDGRPAIVPDGLVTTLQAGEAARRCQMPESAKLAPGAVVGLSRGIFAGHRGPLLEVEKDRGVVLLMAFGYPRRVNVPLSELISATDLED